MLEPASIEELQSTVTAHDRVLPVGNRTKPRLSSAGDGCQIISTRRLTGITEYEPSEYTFTALAGTPLSEIHATLETRGQFLPCDPLLRDTGATLGGAIASGLSGSDRFRFGGLRDFLLGIRFVSGEGKLVHAGGKVVKNAAGFDLPKFMVGSLGRYGILAEVTFKVFPSPPSRLTLKVPCESHGQAVERMCVAASSRWELYAIDYDPRESAIYMRLGGPSQPIQKLADEISTRWQGCEQVDEDCWKTFRELDWVPENQAVAKVPITPKAIPALQAALDDAIHYSVAGNVATIASSDLPKVSHVLRSLQLSGMTFLGDADAPLWIGTSHASQIANAVKSAIDRQGRFPTLTD